MIDWRMQLGERWVWLVDEWDYKTEAWQEFAAANRTKVSAPGIVRECDADLLAVSAALAQVEMGRLHTELCSYLRFANTRWSPGDAVEIAALIRGTTDAVDRYRLFELLVAVRRAELASPLPTPPVRTKTVKFSDGRTARITEPVI